MLAARTNRGVAFSTTRWSLVAALRETDPANRDAARAELVRRCWPAVYAWLRRAGHRPDAAEELTQAFFADVVLGRQLLETASVDKGRLRSLILTALQRHLIDAARRRAVDPSRRPIALSELRAEETRLGAASVEPAFDPARPSESLDAAFDRRWALSMLHEALRRCESHFADQNKTGHWRLFEARVLHPTTRALETPSLAQGAAEHGFPSAAAAGAALQTVKLRLAAVLREVVRETVLDEREVDDELRVVMGVVRSSAEHHRGAPAQS